jgi:pilus assembly protein CpaE
MPIFFYTAAADAAEADKLEKKIRSDIPELRKVSSIEELLGAVRRQAQETEPERTYLLLPLAPDEHVLNQIATIARQHRDVLFFILISRDISGNDYKRLVRLGNADWVSVDSAARDILDILARHQRGTRTPDAPNGPQATIATFLPSAGGTGNSTLAVEAAVQLKTQRATRARAVCLIDLDFQTSHVCDLLDIEPRLRIDEIARDPDRLDDQLCDLFISQHTSSGLDVMASPRHKDAPVDLSIAALDALFDIVSQRYDLIVIDLPVWWLSWTRQILGVSDLLVVTGLLTIPGLRQVAETLGTVRAAEHVPQQICVALNRCRRRLLRGIEGEHFAKRVLKDEKVLYVREDTAAAQHAVNTGIPISIAAPASKTSKDVRQLVSLLSELRSARAGAA